MCLSERNAGQQKATLRMGSVSDIDIRMNTQTGMDLEVETEGQGALVLPAFFVSLIVAVLTTLKGRIAEGN